MAASFPGLKAGASAVPIVARVVSEKCVDGHHRSAKSVADGGLFPDKIDGCMVSASSDRGGERRIGRGAHFVF
jgi:hypothetical protein